MTRQHAKVPVKATSWIRIQNNSDRKFQPEKKQSKNGKIEAKNPKYERKKRLKIAKISNVGTPFFDKNP